MAADHYSSNEGLIAANAAAKYLCEEEECDVIVKRTGEGGRTGGGIQGGGDNQGKVFRMDLSLDGNRDMLTADSTVRLLVDTTLSLSRKYKLHDQGNQTAFGRGQQGDGAHIPISSSSLCGSLVSLPLCLSLSIIRYFSLQGSFIFLMLISIFISSLYFYLALMCATHSSFYRR